MNSLKRKRSETELQNEDSDTFTETQQALTEKNLEEHTQLSSGRRSSSGGMPKMSSSSKKSGTGASDSNRSETPTSIDSAARTLEKYCIYHDSGASMPKVLVDFIASITSFREGTPSPQSLKVAMSNKKTMFMSEAQQIHDLEEHLGYKPELKGGEKHIAREQDRRWHKEAFPNIDPYEPNEEIREAYAKEPPAPSPAPDVEYGHTETAFTDQELKIIKHVLPKECCVYPGEPFFPFWCNQWKSEAKFGNMLKANMQALRDGAAAVYSLWELYQSRNVTSTAADTAAFTSCVDGRHIEIRVHWRSYSEGKSGSNDRPSLSWECALIASARLSNEQEVYQVRGVIYKILDWARDVRLLAIKNLSQMKQRQPTSSQASAGSKRKGDFRE